MTEETLQQIKKLTKETLDLLDKSHHSRETRESIVMAQLKKAAGFAEAINEKVSGEKENFDYEASQYISQIEVKGNELYTDLLKNHLTAFYETLKEWRNK